jgi:NADPH2:quinone reductase
VSSDEKATIAHAHGCHHPIVSTRENFVERIDQITQGAKLPVVYDSVGKDTFAGSLECLRPRGLMVVSGRSSGPAPSIDPAILAQHGSLFLTRTVVFDYTRTPGDLDIVAAEVFEVVRSGRVKVRINQRFALDAAAEAHRALENRRTTGATILSAATWRRLRVLISSTHL